MRCLVLLVLALLAGCSSPSSYLAMTVHVRDRVTQGPVADATVDARPVHLFVPSSTNDLVNPTPPASTRGTTDAAGTVTLDVVVNYPVHIIVVASGYEPLEVDLQTHPGHTGEPGPWLDPDSSVADMADRRLLEVRFVP